MFLFMVFCVGALLKLCRIDCILQYNQAYDFKKIPKYVKELTERLTRNMDDKNCKILVVRANANDLKTTYFVRK